MRAAARRAYADLGETYLDRRAAASKRNAATDMLLRAARTGDPDGVIEAAARYAAAHAKFMAKDGALSDDLLKAVQIHAAAAAGIDRREGRRP